MRWVSLALLAVLASPAWAGDLPDPSITPGLAASTDVSEVCAVGSEGTYSQRHRHTTIAMKLAVLRAYGRVPGRAGDGEVDHLIPLCLGGADDLRNLWWQPGNDQGTAWTYHLKDRLEALACREVCARHVSLREAQSWFTGDWRVAYCRQVGPCEGQQ